MKPLLPALSGTSVLAVIAALSCYVAGSVVTSVPARSSLTTEAQQIQPEDPNEANNTARSPRSKIYYAAIVERPLFAPERRPKTQVAADDEQEPAIVAEPVMLSERPDVSVHGVMVDASGSKALISVAEESPQWAELGTSIGGWTVSDIGPDWVELGLATETFRFEMYQ
ncbi:hypothetical protein [Ruegeria sp.]|uniref:hypothetical protein n=1 Tax=Ruegeria sp. TaxID=1879320 RepID=UPI00231F900B|nr:hypothetical protein [Ruegeria sp.]MDA7966148.1 hypothetical protein [Ruegeria sp.]